jgi:hypothetical protein
MIYDDLTSSAMNYYEELGVTQDATEQEIRKAHRRLVKLMHPDAQPDQNLKMLAETQMRRLNSIVSTLLDPEQRRAYDAQLHAGPHAPNRPATLLPSWRGIPWWLASAVGAVVLTLGAVWLWADHMGNSYGRHSRSAYISVPENTPPAEISGEGAPGLADPPSGQMGSASYSTPVAKQPSTVSDQPQADGGVSTAVVPDVQPELHAKEPLANNLQPAGPRTTVKLPEVRDDELPKPAAPKVAAVVSNKPRSTTPDLQKTAGDAKPPTAATTKAAEAQPVKKIFSLPAGTVTARAVPNKNDHSQLPPPPGVPATGRDYSSAAMPPSSLPAAAPPKLAAVTTAAGSGSAVAGLHDPLEGEWVYAPKEPERRKAGFYPPEFIDLKLFGAGDAGNLKGQYNAKYVVTDRPVSPDVSFELASVAKGSRKFVWQSNNGAKGTLSIDPIDERTIRIDWHTTSAVRGPALTSGTATLVRRQ